MTQPSSHEALATQGIIRKTLRIDVSTSVELPGQFEIAADLIHPEALDERNPPPLLFCLPGGYLSRKYFDLEIDGHRHYSFAEYMARHGFMVAAIDHLGVGDSTVPDTPAGLGVDALAGANQSALTGILDRLLTASEVGINLTRAPETIGVGHSMGSGLTVAQQALHSSHLALLLFCFSTAGLPAFLGEKERSWSNQPERAHAEVPGWIHERQASGHPAHSDSGEEGIHANFVVGTAPPDAERALYKASTRLLTVPGLLSIIPGAYRPYADRIRCPVFVAAGDHDLHTAQEVPPMLPHSPDVVAFTLEDSWHCHLVANTRARLLRRTAAWVESMLTCHAEDQNERSPDRKGLPL